MEHYSEYFPVEQLELSCRSANCLKNKGIVTVGQLRRTTDRELMRIPNFGKISLREVRYLVPFSTVVVIPGLDAQCAIGNREH